MTNQFTQLTEEQLETEYNKLTYNYIAYMIFLFLGFILVIFGAIMYRDEPILVLSFGIISILISVVFSMICLYKSWDYIIREIRNQGMRTSVNSPGEAVFSLFIPFYNFYWIFVAYGKLPEYFNALSNKRLNRQVMPNGFGHIIAVFTLISVIPYVGIIFSLINSLILLPIFYKKVINGIEEIPLMTEPLVTMQKKESFVLNPSEIKDYSQFFDSKNIGINYWFGLFLLISSVLVNLIVGILFRIEKSYSFSGFFDLKDFLYSLFVISISSLLFVVFSHALRNKVLLSLMIGLSSAVVAIIGRLNMLFSSLSYIDFIFNKAAILQYIYSFMGGLLFVLSLSLFIKINGFKFWNILLALLINSVLINGISLLVEYLGNEGAINFSYFQIYAPLIYVLFESIAIYCAFLLYIKPKNDLVPNPQLIDSDL